MKLNFIIIVLMLVIGSPVFADDVELLLAVPDAGTAKPNILFILDSSGSMKSEETTTEPYDETNLYSGSCDTSYYYWTTFTSVPSCSSDQRVQKSSVVCSQASQSSGKYTDTMIMYRLENDKLKWSTLESGFTDQMVECLVDSGIHGDGTVGEVFAQIGSDVEPFTSDPVQEVVWENQETVTLYDGNYLNWYNDPPTVTMTRNEIVKAVTKNVLASISNANIGLMRFDYQYGGPVTHAISDLDTNRDSLTAVIDDLPANGYTPLSETLYEAARYWRGMNSDYGDIDDTDPNAYQSSNNGIMDYTQPVEYACSKNFNVILTDGEPTRDLGTHSRINNLPNYSTTLGRSNCTGGFNHGACLDDVAEYLYKTDISTLDGDQNVITYTIGFDVDLPLLEETANNAGGQYYLADNVQTLTQALTDIVKDIFDRDISFTAPTVAVNTFNRTQHLNDLYVSVFRAQTEYHWPGNVKKYSIANDQIVDANNNLAIDPATGYFADNSDNFWNTAPSADGPDVRIGGAANVLPDPLVRNVYTNNGPTDLTAQSNAITVSNSGAFSLADFGLTGGPDEPDLTQIIQWARGVDVRDEDNDPSTSTREVMGDTLHSQPASIVYGNQVIVFVATNDGYLHALNSETGQELWSFVPKELLGDFGDLYFNETVNFKHYGIDGNLVPIVADRNNNGEIDSDDFVYLVFGMRRGGNNYYMLDITDYASPKVKWVKTFPGQSWSTPIAAKVEVNSGAVSSPDNAVLVVGGGYDTKHDQTSHPSTPDDGASIFMLDIETGDTVWRTGSDFSADLALNNMTRSFVSAVRVIDLNGDNFADRMYAADLGGQIWRFDITNDSTPQNLVTGGVIAQLGAEGSSPTPANTRRFYTSPDVSMFFDPNHEKHYLAISIGSGYRAHPLDDSAADRFYSLRDKDAFVQLTQSEYNNYDIATDDELVDVSGSYGNVITTTDRGWKFVLPVGQKVLSNSRTFDNAIYFVSFEAISSSENPCQAGRSLNRLYKVNVVNGDPVTDFSVLDPNNPDEIDNERVTNLEQDGIVSEPVFLFPSPEDPENCEGNECSPPPIYCVGVECFNPGFNNRPVRTVWTQDGIQ